MAQIMNFKKMEVTGATKEEALAKAPFNTNLPGADCTQALRLFKEKHAGQVFTDALMCEFMLEQLEKKTRNTAGNGCYIVVSSAVSDTRERPYRIDDVANKKGARNYKTIIQVTDNETGRVLLETSEPKADAKEMVKVLYTEKGYKGNVTARYTKQVVEGEPVAFTATYTPSKSSRPGVYLVFGMSAE